MALADRTQLHLITETNMRLIELSIFVVLLLQKVGGTGIRYTIMVCDKETYLFDEENGKWFVEAKSRRTD